MVTLRGMRNGTSTQPEQTPPGSPDYAQQRREILDRIGRLQRKSGHGPIAIALFLAVSIVAQQDFSILPSLPDDVLNMLGHPPSPNMISAALVLYSFSAIILILARMMSGSDRYGGVSHVGYILAFYTFYHFAHALAENFWAVFAAGMTVLALESYYMWNHCAEEIKKERELLVHLDRKEKSGFDI